MFLLIPTYIAKYILGQLRRFACHQGTFKAHSATEHLTHYLGTCPLPLPTASETPRALNLPSQQSLGIFLEALASSRQLLQLLQHGPQPPLGTCLPPLPPSPLPGRCSCSCIKSKRPQTSTERGLRHFSVSGATDDPT